MGLVQALQAALEAQFRTTASSVPGHLLKSFYLTKRPLAAQEHMEQDTGVVMVPMAPCSSKMIVSLSALGHKLAPGHLLKGLCLTKTPLTVHWATSSLMVDQMVEDTALDTAPVAPSSSKTTVSSPMAHKTFYLTEGQKVRNLAPVEPLAVKNQANSSALGHFLIKDLPPTKTAWVRGTTVSPTEEQMVGVMASDAPLALKIQTGSSIPGLNVTSLLTEAEAARILGLAVPPSFETHQGLTKAKVAGLSLTSEAAVGQCAFLNLPNLSYSIGVE